MHTVKAKTDVWPIKNEIERKAEEILGFCQRMTGTFYLPTKVPIEQYLEGPLGIRLEVTDLSYLGRRVIGVADPEGKTICISTTIEDHEGCYRFTLAHELGHIILGDRIVTATLSDIHKREVRANEFASYFLMPWSGMERTLKIICCQNQMNQKATISRLPVDSGESRWLWKYKILPYFTKKMGVSLSAAVYRFNGLKLQNKMPFLPDSMVEYLLCSEMSIQSHLVKMVKATNYGAFVL